MNSDDTNTTASPDASGASRQRPRRRATRTFGASTDAVTVPQPAGGTASPFEITLPQPAASDRPASDRPAEPQSAEGTLDVLAELSAREPAASGSGTRSRRASRPTAAPEVTVDVPSRPEPAKDAGAPKAAAPDADAPKAVTRRSPKKKSAPASDAGETPEQGGTVQEALASSAVDDEGAPAKKAPAKRAPAKKKATGSTASTAEPAATAESAPTDEPASAAEPAAATQRKAPARKAPARKSPSASAPDSDSSDATPARPPRLATTALLFQAPDPTTAPRRNRRAQAPAGAPHATGEAVQVPTFASARKAPAPTEERAQDAPATPAAASVQTSASAPAAAPVQTGTSTSTADEQQPRARRGRKRASRPAGSAAPATAAPTSPTAAPAPADPQTTTPSAQGTGDIEPLVAPTTPAFALAELPGDDRLAIDEVELIERELLDEGVEDRLPEFDVVDFAEDVTSADGAAADASRAENDVDTVDSVDTDDTDDDESAASGARRRRRRGGRGRRRSPGGADTDRSDEVSREATSDDGGADGQATDDLAGSGASTGGRRDDARDDRDDARDDRDDAHDDSDQDRDTEGAGSSRRRRRRRRGGSTSSTSSSSASSSTETPTSRAARASDEVTALKGSTRLEAKRQRRREGRDAGRRRQTITEAEFLARRESVQRSMIVREKAGRTQIAVLEDGVLVEHYVSQQAQASMVGNVYLGRVQNVLPSMEAAFVDIGKGRNAVLYAGEVNWDAAGADGQPRRIEQALKSGDAILVQVTKDPIGHKGARLTSQVTLAGRYLVFVPGGGMTGISRKLPDTERNRLKKILREIVPEGAGVIVRTAAEGASEDELRADVARLQSQWEAIDTKSKRTSSAPALLQGEPDLAIRVVRDIFNDDFGSLVVSGDGAWSEISSYLTELAPDLASRASRWVGGGAGGADADVFAEHRIDEQLAKGMDRKVWLPSGGSLVIDRTEAMTVVDVNTGKFTGSGGTLEETVTRNNLEAAEEIVRQLRLRDIGGIIVIDFIDMVLESNRDLVLRRLVECLGRDRTKHQVAEVTSLGLVQMTRKRVGQGLVEAFSETCAACNGRGFIVHSDPIERGGNHQHGSTDQSDDDQGDARRSSSNRRRRSKPSETAGGGSGHTQTVPVLPESRDAVKATLATIAAAAAHAHEHDHDPVRDQSRDAAAQDAVRDLVLEGRDAAPAVPAEASSDSEASADSEATAAPADDTATIPGSEAPAEVVAAGEPTHDEAPDGPAADAHRDDAHEDDAHEDDAHEDDAHRDDAHWDDAHEDGAQS